MKIYAIGNEDSIKVLISKNSTKMKYKINADTYAFEIENPSHKRNLEDIDGISIISRDKFVRFLESNNIQYKNEEESEDV